MGLLTGTALGVGLGMLFAPKAGSALRTELSEEASAFATQAQERYRQATQDAGEWVETGKKVVGEWVERGTEAATRGGGPTHDRTSDSRSRRS